MSRKAVITFLAVYLAVVLAISVLWALATPGIADVRREVIVGGIIGRAVGALVLSGIIPLIYWAIRRSRADASGVLAVWAILGAVIFVLSAAGDMYDGTLQPAQITLNVTQLFQTRNAPNSIAASPNDRDDFIRLAKSSCVDAQRKKPINRQMGVVFHSLSVGRKPRIVGDVERQDKSVFDSIIVVTDRRLLDDQLNKTIKNFLQVGSTVGHAEHSGDLQSFIEGGKKIIVSTVQKFPYILEKRSGASIADDRSPSLLMKPIRAKAERRLQQSARLCRRPEPKKTMKRWRTKSIGSWKRKSCFLMQATLRLRRLPRTKRWRYSESHLKTLTRSGIARSMPTQ
jgi:hypothetical protein